MLSTKEVLKRLRALREEKYLKQEHLARHLGVDRTTYIRKEKGCIPITTGEWLKLAQAMEKDPSYFFNSNHKGGQNAGEKETVLVKLYRSLSLEEKRDLIACVRLVLKGIKKKKVRDAIQMLVQP